MMNFVVLLLLCLITAILRKSTKRGESTLTWNSQMVGTALCPVPVPTGMNQVQRLAIIYTLTLS